MQSVNPSPTNTWKIAALAFGALISYWIVESLYYIFLPNQIKFGYKYSNYILNDARIMITTFSFIADPNSDQWLSQQEIKLAATFQYQADI